jgi:DNA helicase-2/ATP-dependent DNA helicase PcrA
MLDRMAEAAVPFDVLGGLRPPAAAAADWPAFRQLMEGLGACPWPAAIDAVDAWYRPHLERRYEDAAIRAADIVQLARIAATAASRTAFLTELTLDPPGATSAESGPPLLDEDYLVLSTIHSAKGQEWRSVHLLNTVDGCLPSDLGTGETADIEEERRLLYVAMTRAKDDLHLLVPQRFYTHQQARRGDRHVYAARTRFIPSSLLALFEPVTWPAAGAEAAAAARPAEPVIDLGARLRAMWA